MTTLEIVLGIILLIGALFLIVAVLMQHGKAKSLSGTIAGGAETFFGKTKGRAIDKVLSRVTSVVAVVFVVLVVVMYGIESPNFKPETNINNGLGGDDYHGVITTEASTEATEPAESEATEATEATDATTAAAE